MFKPLKESAKYEISQDGILRNAQTKVLISQKDGAARITLNGKQIQASIKKLVEGAWGAQAPAVVKETVEEEKKTTAEKVVAPKKKKKDKVSLYTPEEKATIDEINLSKVSGAEKVRRVYQLSPDKFDALEISKLLDISYDRVYGCIRKWTKGLFKRIPALKE
jgi:hypothetical protein